MDHVTKEIQDLMGFYSAGMESAKRIKNYEKYYRFLEAYEALDILLNRLKLNEEAA